VFGNTAFVGFAIALFVLIVLWLWLNVTLIRRMRTEQARTSRVSSPTDGPTKESTAEPNGRVQEKVPGPASEPVERVVGQTSDGRQSRAERVPDDASDAVSDSEDAVDSPEVYVLESTEKRTVLNGQQVPFYLKHTPDSPFLSADWITSLRKLSEDSNILGWVAFYGNTVGASDHRYDDALTEALRSYRLMLERLRKEVGLTQVEESSIVGVEGKIWMFTRGDDIWFALFLDNAVNAPELVKELLSLRTSATTP
jgi:hypothetical protein